MRVGTLSSKLKKLKMDYVRQVAKNAEVSIFRRARKYSNELSLGLSSLNIHTVLLQYFMELIFNQKLIKDFSNCRTRINRSNSKLFVWCSFVFCKQLSMWYTFILNDSYNMFVLGILPLWPTSYDFCAPMSSCTKYSFPMYPFIHCTHCTSLFSHSITHFPHSSGFMLFILSLLLPFLKRIYII